MLELPDKNIWTGRMDDEDGELGLRWHQIIQTKLFSELSAHAEEKIAVLGFCSDEGVRRNKGRIGAKSAPDQIRKSLANLPYNPAKQLPIVDFGNIILTDDDLESTRTEQVECVAELLRNNYFPVILGGGHETALGDYLGMAFRFDKIGIINIDAHFDLRIPVENSTSGTPFFEIAHFCTETGREFHYFTIGIQPNGNTQALFQRAEELNVKTILADEVHIDLNFVLRQIEDFTNHFDAIYLSLDLDVLDGAFAPGVSAPSVNGLMPFQVKSIVQKIIQTQKVKLFDIVELNPELDQDNRTAKLAAHFIQEATFR